MNVQPDASVSYLEPAAGSPRSPDTERSANRALLATIKALESQLAEQRAAYAALEKQNGEYAMELTHQTAQNRHMRSALKEADARLAGPIWQRRKAKR